MNTYAAYTHTHTVTVMDSPQNMQLPRRKTAYYTFFPVKAEEARHEATLARLNKPHGASSRCLVEIHPALVRNPKDPWQIKRILTRDEVIHGKITIPFQELFEYILRYWTLDTARLIVEEGRTVRVPMLDVTNNRNPRRYESLRAHLEMMPNNEAYIQCVKLMFDSDAEAGDTIGLYWDLDKLYFTFKRFPAVN